MVLERFLARVFVGLDIIFFIYFILFYFFVFVFGGAVVYNLVRISGFYFYFYFFLMNNDILKRNKGRLVSSPISRSRTQEGRERISGLSQL